MKIENKSKLGENGNNLINSVKQKTLTITGDIIKCVHVKAEENLDGKS